jgi:Ca2+-transporting ATPase
LSIAALIAYGYGISRYGVGSRASTIVFMSLTVGQVLHAFSCRSEYRYWFSQKPLPRNPYVEAAVVGSLALQLLPLAIPGLGVLLKLAPIEGWDYGVIGLSALAPLLISELTKPAAPAVQASQPLL